ncbi:MAG: N-acetyltransferase, partial [Propionibacteriaceae bacterium]|nr:N-acetyltransferase [Propionibacteriaceae bacterium]
ADLNHTYVGESARGTGLAGRLAQFAFDQIRAEGEWTILPTCPYVISWVRRHPDYADLLVESTG